MRKMRKLNQILGESSIIIINICISISNYDMFSFRMVLRVPQAKLSKWQRNIISVVGTHVHLCKQTSSSGSLLSLFVNTKTLGWVVFNTRAE